MNKEKELTLKQVIWACKPEIEKAAAEVPGFAKIVAAKGKKDAKTGRYVALGWGLFVQGEYVYWHTDCTYNLASIHQQNYRGASACGQCPHGTKYAIYYVA